MVHLVASNVSQVLPDQQQANNLFASSIAFFALILEGLIGYPQWVQKRISHPKMYIERFISKFQSSKYFLLGVILIPIAVGTGIEIVAKFLGTLGFLALILIATTGFSQLALDRGAERVYKEVKVNNIDKARAEFAKVTGESAATLSMTEIIEGSTQRLAWGFSAAAVAPAFWLLVLDLPGLFLYMTISIAAVSVNTKDAGLIIGRIAFVMDFVPVKVAGFLRRVVNRSKKHSSESTLKGFKEAIRISHRAHMLLWVIVFLVAFL